MTVEAKAVNVLSTIPCSGMVMNILQDESCDESVFFRYLSDASEKVKMHGFYCDHLRESYPIFPRS